MKKQSIYLFLSVFVLCASCTEDAGWLESEESAQLIVGAMWCSDNVGKQMVSVRLTGVQQTRPVEDATFRLCVNGEIVDSIHSLTYTRWDVEGNCWLPYPTSSYGNYYLNYAFHPGDEVSLEVKTPTRVARSETVVPLPIEILQVDTLHIESNKDDKKLRQIRFLIKVRLADEMKGMQYFRLEVDDEEHYYWAYDQYRDGMIDYVCDMSPHFRTFTYDADLALKENEQEEDDDNYFGDWQQSTSNMYYTFRSSMFQKREYTLCVDVEDQLDRYLDDPNASGKYAGYQRLYHWRIYTLSKLEYLYLNSLAALASFDSEELTSTPPIVPSNIEGGTGFFSISAKAEYTFTDGPGQLIHEGDPKDGQREE